MNYNNYINGANYLLGDPNVKRVNERFERTDREVDAPDCNMISKGSNPDELKIGVTKEVTALTEQDLDLLQNHMEELIKQKLVSKSFIVEQIMREKPSTPKRESIEDYLGSQSVEAWEVL